MDKFCQLLYDGAYVYCPNLRQRGEILRYVSQNGLSITNEVRQEYCDTDPGDGDDRWKYVCTYRYSPDKVSCWSRLPTETGALGVGSDRLSLTYEDFLAYINPVTVSVDDMQNLFGNAE